jgi:hypothetical protein
MTMGISGRINTTIILVPRRRKMRNLALERLAHATCQRGPLMASRLQALVICGVFIIDPLDLLILMLEIFIDEEACFLFPEMLHD